MDKFPRIALLLTALALLSACGAKGPLILPENAAPIDAPAQDPTDNTPQIDTTTTPADQQAEDAVEDPAPPVPNG